MEKYFAIPWGELQMQYLHHCEAVMSQYNITGKYSIALSSAMRNVEHNLLFELCEGVIYDTPKKCLRKMMPWFKINITCVI